MSKVEKLNEQYADKIDQDTGEWIGSEQEWAVYVNEALQLAFTK